MSSSDMVLSYCNSAQLIEKLGFTRGHFQVQLESGIISQKLVEHQTGTEITPIQCELLFQDIDMLKSNWVYFEVNV